MNSTESRIHKCIQQPGESVDTFYAELCKLVKRCKYLSSAVKECLVCDRFVVGLRDMCLSDHLCRSLKLTLKEAWTQAHQSEDADKECSLAQATSQAPVNIDAAKARKFPSRDRVNARTAPSMDAKTECCHRKAPVCPYCGRAFRERSQCPARNSVCNFCGKKGHFAEVCRSRKSEHAKLGAIELHALESSAKAKFVDVTVDNYITKFNVDSGAEVSTVPINVVTATERCLHISPSSDIDHLCVVAHPCEILSWEPRDNEGYRDLFMNAEGSEPKINLMKPSGDIFPKMRIRRLSPHAFSTPSARCVPQLERLAQEASSRSLSSSVSTQQQQQPKHHIPHLCLDSNPIDWTVGDVARFIAGTNCAPLVRVLQEQEIDGQALLLLTLPLVQEFLELQPAPAIQFCQLLERIKLAFYLQYGKESNMVVLDIRD
ncbi:hypothetical protein HPB49_017587 [Dermacentor silvarum]|uniref:Uncharacterized protein n=1 Tax=Dermacentor silvarum TaxID=543639 RepID=A0ACB8CAP9_DERSI|nr:hypothetical protein HPB49_017587 [Dermacentor silvarum]